MGFAYCIVLYGIVGRIKFREIRVELLLLQIWEIVFPFFGDVLHANWGPIQTSD
jgi:hypothetical protein